MKALVFAATAAILWISPAAKASEPSEVVEKALKTYCDKNKVDRAKLESFKLDLIPGTQTFRYWLPPLKAPAGSTYGGLQARSSFVIVDAKSGDVIDVKATEAGYSIVEATPKLFAAMKAAGVKIKTDDDATKVMRTVIFLEHATRQTEAKMEDVNHIKSKGRIFYPDEYEGGAFCWSCGDRIGLHVDKDDYATYLSGGHLK